MNLLLLTVTLWGGGVSNKHCLLSLFSLSMGKCLYTKLTSKIYYTPASFKILLLKMYNDEKEYYLPVFQNLCLRVVMLFGFQLVTVTTVLRSSLLHTGNIFHT